MTARKPRDPSPVKSAFVHSALGAATLVCTFGIAGAFIHFTGDVDDASPAIRMALFEEVPEEAPKLNPRLPGEDRPSNIILASVQTGLPEQDTQPSLGVDYAGSLPANPKRPVRTEVSQGIRINGQTVLPGQSYSQALTTDKAASEMNIAAIAVPAVPARQPEIDLNTPFAKYARPFENPEGKPTVSIVVGGLGINWGRTQAAINELPPEVTLSFAPTATNLSKWVRDARRAGHEVLIELPMEPYDYGRLRPHPQILQAEASTDTNLKRLSKLLARVNGYAGVINYQGDKFATNPSAVQPIVERLDAKGLAFFQDGSLDRSVFAELASKEGLPHGVAIAWVDERPEADEISNQFLRLEAEALENGSALGTALSFPITFDMLGEWLPQLEEKGILLAPASYHAKRSRSSGQLKLAELDQQG